MSKIIVNLSNNKGKNKNNSKFQLSHLQNSLLMSIVDTPEKDLPNVDQKLDMIKVRTYSVKSSSILFSCSICAMYNRINSAQKQRIMFNLYVPEINTLIFSNMNYDNIFSEKLVYELYAWI